MRGQEAVQAEGEMLRNYARGRRNRKMWADARACLCSLLGFEAPDIY